MTTIATRTISRPADLAALALGFSLWVLGLAFVRTAGVGAVCAYLLGMEVLLLLWIWANNKSHPLPATRFALKVQLTLSLRIAATVLATIVALGLNIALLNLIASTSELDAVLNSSQTRSFIKEIILLAALSAPCITLWYLHALQRRALAFTDLATGNYLEARLVFSCSHEQVQQRLDAYLRQLASEQSAPLPTWMYGNRPTLTSLSAPDGVAIYECTWTWMPAKLVIEVRPQGAGGSAVLVACKLRGGYFRHELAVVPNEAIMLLEHVQAHVLQPLAKDMAQRESEQRQETLRVQAMEMRLKVLQAQVEPHFLFNAMANLRQMYRNDVVAGETMLNHLIGYLRGAMDGLRAEQSTVAQELELVRHYLAIMKVRMGERLRYSFVSHDEIGATPFPPAMLISLVENAIKHGLHDKPDGQLRITAARDGGKLTVSVIDNGPGFGSMAGTGVGLSNIRQRLEAMYGHQAWLEAGALADGGFVSTIVVPVIESPVHA